jgi:hypothetical protein
VNKEEKIKENEEWEKENKDIEKLPLSERVHAKIKHGPYPHPFLEAD